MDNIHYRKIDSFKDYCQKRTINEDNANIKVEIDWWDEAIEVVMNELHKVAGSPIGWDSLLDYCRAKWLVLGREITFFVNELVLAHIRDLIFQFYGESLFCGEDLSGSSHKNASLGTKILVVSQLGNTILHQVKVEAGIEIDPEKPDDDSPNTVASVSLEGEDYPEDDLPFERRVIVFEDYTKALNETYCHLQFDHYNTVIDKCLKDLEPAQEKGTIVYDKVLKMARKEINESDDSKCIDKYLAKLARKHMEKEQITVGDVNLVDMDDMDYTKTKVLKSAKDLFTYNMVKDLKGRMSR